MAEFVRIQHPDIEQVGNPPRVTRRAFELIWAAKGWVVIEPAAEPTPTATEQAGAEIPVGAVETDTASSAPLQATVPEADVAPPEAPAADAPPPGEPTDESPTTKPPAKRSARSAG